MCCVLGDTWSRGGTQVPGWGLTEQVFHRSEEEGGTRGLTVPPRLWERMQGPHSATQAVGRGCRAFGLLGFGSGFSLSLLAERKWAGQGGSCSEEAPSALGSGL